MYRVKCSTALKDPKKFYDRVIANCWNRRGEPMVLVRSVQEQKEWERKYGK